MFDQRFFPRQVVEASGNPWDWALLPLVRAVLSLLALVGSQMVTSFQVDEVLSISLVPWALPSTLHIFLAQGASVIFACAFAVQAAKYRPAEKVLLPLQDILQSISILGFLSIRVSGLIAVLPGSLLGVACAASLAILTSQAWNMAFSLYQSMCTVPAELIQRVGELREEPFLKLL